MSFAEVFTAVLLEVDARIKQALREQPVNLASRKIRGVLPGRNLPTSGNTGSGYTPAIHDINTSHTGILEPDQGGMGVNNASRTLTISTNSGTLAFGAASKILTINASLGLGGTDNKTLTLNGDLMVSANLSLAGTAGKTLTISNSLTLAGTDGKSLTLTGALTIGADTSITGGGTIALGGFTLTVPATGTAALGTGTANQVTYWSGTNAVTSNSMLTVDTANKVLTVETGAAATQGSVRIGSFGTSDYARIIHISQSQMSIDKFSASGQALIDVNPRPADGSSAANFRFFRSTSTSGASSFDIFLGDGSATFNHRIFGQGGHTQLCLNNGALLVGRSSGLTGTGDLDVNGKFRAHGSSASGAQSADAGALAGAAAGWETNAQTTINAFRTCLRDHGLMA